MGYALNTDLYEITMAQSYFDSVKMEDAVFSLFVRKLPMSRGFLVSAGLETFLNKIQNFKFDEDDLNYLRSLNRFSDDFLEYLKKFKFSGNIYAIPEGRIIFENEPLLQVEGCLIDTQIIETIAINILHYQTLIASKAARSVIAAQDRQVIDFGLRRAHSIEAGLYAARAEYIVGFQSTSNLNAGKKFNIPVVGTMAHSYVMIFESEEESFKNYAKKFPNNATFLIDTYDTLKAVETIVDLALNGVPVIAVRIDSGNLEHLSKSVRKSLDNAGLEDVKIIVSGGLDEYDVQVLLEKNSPIDVFALGTKIVTSSDRPYLDMAYKLVEYGGQPKLKLSPGKVTFPYKRQVFRYYTSNGEMEYDKVVKYGEECEGESLVIQVLEGGKNIFEFPTLYDIKKKFEKDLNALPMKIKRLEPSVYKVVVK